MNWLQFSILGDFLQIDKPDSCLINSLEGLLLQTPDVFLKTGYLAQLKANPFGFSSLKFRRNPSEALFRCLQEFGYIKQGSKRGLVLLNMEALGLSKTICIEQTENHFQNTHIEERDC